NSFVNFIESAKNKTEREQKIQDMTVIYSEVESMLAPLRRAELNISYKEPKKSKERIALLSTSKPDSLDSKELLYAATLTKDLNTKLNIYKSVISLYPDNWKGYNNAGCTSFKLGKYDEAGTYFEKANTISPNNAMVLYNLSAIALQKNNLGTAKSYMETAKTQGADINYNLGIILITQGDYEQAMKNFEKNKCSYNMALAQLLLDNITGAKSTLECAEKNADIYYLMAVIGARTSNAQMMNDNLRKAIELNSKFRKEAKKDREFIQFFNNADFMEITKF
ncbi:MAG: tetratricopeptide repeat protein, partial [Bacteroidales bacterium]|nr:tetratricopeptide repeat protein [Bacteroidales bacterium]